MEVHRNLGHGFLENVYYEALAMEFEARSLPFVREAELAIRYKGQRLSAYYRADFICYDSVIVELKAMASAGAVEEAQVLNYLKASGYSVGLLLNFGTPSLTYRRLVFSQSVSSEKSAD